MKISKCFIQGIYRHRQIKISACANKTNNKLYVFFHGAFSSPYSNKKTSIENLAKQLQKTVSVGYYESSRSLLWSKSETMTFEQYAQEAFTTKTFREEFIDAKRAVRYIIHIVSKQTKKPLSITFVGFSFGGITAILLTKYFNNVSALFTFGTGISFHSSIKLPLITTLPSQKEIKNILSEYTGDITIVRGSKDTIALPAKTYKIFDTARQARKRSYIELNGVDHRFISINGITSEKKLNNTILHILKSH